MMKIGVVVPVYNCEAFIEETLRSIAQQDLSADEVWIVNDGSTDGTEAVVESFIRGRKCWHLITQPNAGVSSARNTGVNAANCEWIAFVDSDDLWRLDHLRCLMQDAEKSAADIVVSGVEVFQEKVENILFSYGIKQAEIEGFPRNLFSRNNIVPSAVMMKRAAFLRLGGFDEDRKIQHAEDWDLWLRAFGQGFTFHFTRKATVLYRRHAANATANLAKIQQVCIFCLEKNLKYQPLYPQDMHRSISMFYRRLGNTTALSDRSLAGKYYRAAITHHCSNPLNHIAYILHSLHAMMIYRKLSNLWLTCKLKSMPKSIYESK